MQGSTSANENINDSSNRSSNGPKPISLFQQHWDAMLEYQFEKIRSNCKPPRGAINKGQIYADKEKLLAAVRTGAENGVVPKLMARSRTFQKINPQPVQLESPRNTFCRYSTMLLPMQRGLQAQRKHIPPNEQTSAFL